MTQIRRILFILIITLISFSPSQVTVFAQQSEVAVLQQQIADRNNRLKEIEAEISQYQNELTKVGAERSSLQSAIKGLELERKKVTSDLTYTQNKIGATDLEISKLNLEIEDAQETITTHEQAIGEMIRSLDETDNDSLMESLLRYATLSDFWGTIESLQRVRDVMHDQVVELSSQKVLLQARKEQNTDRRQELLGLKNVYADQQQVLENNKQEKDQLLKVTKSKESEYQVLLAEKRTAREQMERELRDFENKLQFILDPNTIPPPGTPVFNWPLANVVITQLFGGTEFAKQNASVYAGRAYHPGVDFGTPRGTKINAPLAGTVRATGNTDAVPGCYSWGKWTLIDHINGLSTLYAHQDLISVVPGQVVQTGEVIGYTGNTGYSTGPHLHFTVYAKAGVTVRKFNEIKTITSCGPATTPVAATDAYIDPMLYLPPR